MSRILRIAFASSAMLIVGLLAVRPALAFTDTVLDCTLCHECEHPSPADPCLKTETCPRHETMAGLRPDLGPSIVILDQLQKLYVPVRFNHLAHAKMVGLNGGCETCHHFTPPNSPHPGCRECHPSEIVHEDITQPGLKGAYHRNCMACHQEWDHDAACEICHEKVVEGGANEICEHSHYQPIEMQELIIFETDYDIGDKVPFHHLNHSTLYERDCNECHRQQSCKRCHVQGEELHPMGEPSHTNLHDTCYQCHDETNCEDCHGRDSDDLFDHSSTGWRLAGFHEGLSCRKCHGLRGQFEKLSSDCSSCHPGGWEGKEFDHSVTGIKLDDTHGELDCEDCHRNGEYKQIDCTDCHDEGLTYQQLKSFGG